MAVSASSNVYSTARKGCGQYSDIPLSSRHGIGVQDIRGCTSTECKASQHGQTIIRAAARCASPPRALAITHDVDGRVQRVATIETLHCSFYTRLLSKRKVRVKRRGYPGAKTIHQASYSDRPSLHMDRNSARWSCCSILKESTKGFLVARWSICGCHAGSCRPGT
jgi:hypothetical protein